jgi:hypothetical protein
MEEQKLRLQEKIKEFNEKPVKSQLELLMVKNWQRSLKILK